MAISAQALDEAERAIAEGRRLLRVSQLSLRAPGPAQAASLRRELGTALESARFGDGGKLVLLRRLRLPAMPAGVRAPELARAIETAWARAAAAAVHALQASTNSEAVYFHSPAEARLLWLGRSLRQLPAPEWFWAAALPELEAGSRQLRPQARQSVFQALRRIAPRALEGWIAKLGRRDVQDLAAQWQGPLPEPLQRRLSKAQAIPLPPSPTRSADARSPVAPIAASAFAANPPAHFEAAPIADTSAVRVQTQELRAIGPTKQEPDERHLPASAGIEPESSTEDARAQDTSRVATAHRDVHADASQLVDVPGEAATRRTPTSALDGVESQPARRDSEGTEALRVAASPELAAKLESAPVVAGLRPPNPRRLAVARWWDDAEYTPCGGFLYLLNALDRLGFGAYAAKQTPLLASLVLAQLCERLATRVAMSREDPHRGLWQMPAAAADDAETLAFANAAAVDWQRRLHRALRLRVRIGLWNLVRREGWLSLSPTHADLLLPLADVDLRIRRAGLDADPGWLPWFGRIVGFHYLEAGPAGLGGRDG